MPRLVLASALTRWLSPAAAAASGVAAGGGEATFEFDGERLDQVLERLFERHPALRGYVLDERGALRHHVAIFIDGDVLRDKGNLALALAPAAEVYVLQALSGG